MVKVKENTPVLIDGSIDVERWLQELGTKGYFKDLELIRNACVFAQCDYEHATDTGLSCLQLGLSIADVLADLEVDQETIAAGIVYSSVHYAELSSEDVAEQLGVAIAKMVNGIEQMNAISNLEPLNKYPQNKHQVDNIRKMLLAMVDDVRVVLIKLAERLCVLRTCSHLPEAMRHQIANEAMEIYAPLANRLGIGAIKWEMEDLAFRYLHEKEYKEIAAGLKNKRLERDNYVNLIVDQLNQQIKDLGINNFAVYGRSKHIHSIYRKMKRKNVSLEEIYDATAVRILVENQEQCYEVLSLVHSRWKQISQEFDDYIVKQKPNGYQSLHTAVIGPQNKTFEVQIRTFDMHEQAEMGVAAHWKYKEGATEKKESHERKIDWLREVLAWHKEMASKQGIGAAMENQFLEDRVYVFTPNGDILDFPQGVTPLDFAYHVHSDLGHRCRGAKVKGKIVPLTYELKTGDQVEILTGKESRPSRDWINPHLNYLKTSRAKSKVLHWFKMQNYDKNKAEGQEIIDKELKTLGVKSENLQEVLHSLNFKKLEDFYAAIGRGDIKIGQILSRLSPVEVSKEPVLTSKREPEISGVDLKIEGVGNLLTHMAKCCQPLPGDEVIGYITLGRGVAIHRKDCQNILHCGEKQQQRFVNVNWGNVTKDRYVVDVLIKAFNRVTLIKDITSLFANEKAQVYSLQTEYNEQENIAYITTAVEIENLYSLSRLLNKISQITNVIEARRKVH